MWDIDKRRKGMREERKNNMQKNEKKESNTKKE